jgi:hypothetical protein
MIALFFWKINLDNIFLNIQNSWFLARLPAVFPLHPSFRLTNMQMRLIKSREILRKNFSLGKNLRTNKSVSQADGERERERESQLGFSHVDIKGPVSRDE